MKKLFLLSAMAGLFFASTACAQQDKSKRPSPPAKATATLAGGAAVTIDYSQPALKGRTIGKDVEPNANKVWRAGANEATVFEVSKDVTVEGKALKACKYGLYMIDKGNNNFTVIFSNKWNVWGTVYNESDDALRVDAKASQGSSSEERLTYTVGNDGKVTLAWGTLRVVFHVK